MISVRALLNLLLVLALVAGGLGPVSAGHGMAQAEVAADAAPPCHGEPAAEPVPDPSGNCCGGETCRCDCLHVSAWLVQVLRPPSVLPPGARGLSLRDITPPSAAMRPPLRPPIA
ncbi:CopL family metal-binding regulatory protein [Arenimonas daejeonensis]|uniref:CopL family metal-binding regulatory protein n=1 Tax=Arenimonas daejeonensis TaxID=370777 RepID=UPI0011BDAA53|nr:CopL family metal-binding regulatory protein [Arenimonas daejeonensis]